ncbi:MAG TPA: DUF4331 family protein [Candidatus Dormibacteraeota bacterium]|nr:DUF4331 family protein [Candidatus Dormibacteraeota bacterium]
MRKLVKLLAIATATLALAAPALVGAADHLDAPTVKTNGAIDINDVYVFPGADAANTVLTFTVNPAAGVISGTTFDAAAEYRIQVDTDGDEAEDLTYLFDFAAVAGGTQAYTVTLNGAPFAAGTTGSNVAVASGGQVFAGLVDDPFFFDLNGFNNFKMQLLAGNGIDLSQICDSDPDSNFFAGFNGSAIALEVPDGDLGGTIGVWAETRIDEGSGLVQVERMGKPAINTVFNHTDATKDAYNRALPSGDTADYTDDVAGTVSLIRQELGDSVATADAYGATVAGLLLPDVIGYDTSAAANYAMLNGRALADDVIDISYGVVTDGDLTSDCVASDSAFRAAFPYYAVANAAAATPAPTPGIVPNTATQPVPTSTSLALLLGLGAMLVLTGVASLALAQRRTRR